MKNHLCKKIITLLLFLVINAACGFSENFGIELLKNSDLTVNCPFSFATGDITMFTKADVGVETRIGTMLFKTKKDFFSFGLCTTYNYNYFLFNREEISCFESHSITEGLWLRFLLPHDFIIQSDISAGLAFTKVTATDIRGAKIDNYFNALVIGHNVIVTRRIFSLGAVALYWDAGIEARFYVEQESAFQTFGIVAGLMVKAR